VDRRDASFDCSLGSRSGSGGFFNAIDKLSHPEQRQYDAVARVEGRALLMQPVFFEEF
jgi:hypothetical protein